MARKPTEAQVQGWIDAAAYFERTRLPYDHPRRVHEGGGALADTRRSGENARSRLASHGLWDEVDIRKRAEGGVDLAAVRAERAAADERRTLRQRVEEAAKDATAEQLRAALAALSPS